MKRTTIPKPALLYLISGLLITTLTPVLARYYPMSDLLRGFCTGLGLTLEVIALILIQRSRKNQKCQNSGVFRKLR